MVLPKEKLEPAFGTGDEDGFIKEVHLCRLVFAAQIRTFLCVLQMQAMRCPDFVPRCDPEGEPVCNRFDPQCRRRIDINAATEEQLTHRADPRGWNNARPEVHCTQEWTQAHGYPQRAPSSSE